MSRAPEWLYDLLPAFIRSADVVQGQPLRALMSVLEMEYQAIESDLDLLYENWFVETCEEWVLPYIGDLLGLRGLTGASPEVFSLRGRVGNAIAQRRRKGTLLGLAGAVRDGTGWAPHVVRYRNRVARSGSVVEGEERQPVAARNLDLRRLAAASPSPAAALDGPFHGAAHSVAISGLPPGEAARDGKSPRNGRLSPLALGIYLWRLQLYPVSRGGARRMGAHGTRFTVSPFGIDQPLFWMRPVAAEPSEDESNGPVPEPLGRTAFAGYLEQRTGQPGGWFHPAGWAEGGHGETAGHGGHLRHHDRRGHRRDDDARRQDDPQRQGDPHRQGEPRRQGEVRRPGGGDHHHGAGSGGVDEHAGAAEAPLRVYVSPGAGEPFVEVPLRDLVAADLRQWVFPPHPTANLAVDPELGRLLFADENPVRDVRVGFGYGASADLGGGGYPRRSGRLDVGSGRWEGVVSRDAPPDPLPAEGPFERPGEENVRLYRSVEQALAAWLAAVAANPGPRGPLDARVRILDSALYEFGALPLALPPGCRRLVIEAGAGACPCLAGDLAFRAMAGDQDERPEVILSGLWLDGRVSAGGPQRLRIEHCTLAPPHRDARPPRRGAASESRLGERADEGASVSSLRDAESAELEVAILSSIIGPIDLSPDCRGIAIADSIVDAGGHRDPRAGHPHPPPAVGGGDLGGDGLALRGSAAVCARTTFFGAVSVTQLWASSCLFTGRVEASDLSEGGVRFSFVPPGSTTAQREACQPEAATATAIKPSFTSTRYGDPGYAQLSESTPAVIAAGGEDGCEMGVYHDLYQPQRRGNLPTVLEEFVPWGCEAFVEFVT